MLKYMYLRVIIVLCVVRRGPYQITRVLSCIM